MNVREIIRLLIQKAQRPFDADVAKCLGEIASDVEKLKNKGSETHYAQTQRPFKKDNSITGVSVGGVEQDVEDNVAMLPAYPTKVSQLENDVPFVSKAVADLENYYLKSETYTKEEVNHLVSEIPKFAIEVVDVLPITDISATTIYLLKTSTTEEGNLYTEYIYVKGAWETLGTQKLDLSNYYNKQEVDAKLSGKVDKVSGSSLMTDAEHSKLSGIETGAQKNVQSDWNATTGDALILNKPTIPSIEGLATKTYVDELNVDDVARFILKNDWRIPTYEECKELLDNTTSTWEKNYKGTSINVMILRSKINGKSLVFPCAGLNRGTSTSFIGRVFVIWTSTLSSSVIYPYRLLRYENEGHKIDIKDNRSAGHTIRPVSYINGEDLGLPSRIKWASTNLSVDGLCQNVTDYGDFFAWGELTTKSTFSWANYKFNPKGDGKTFTKYNEEDKKRVIDFFVNLADIEGRIPTLTSQLTNDSGFVTEDKLEDYLLKKDHIPYDDIIALFG